MALLSNIEKGVLVRLFNRGGCVLDFSTADFDAFTLESVGVHHMAYPKENLSMHLSLRLTIQQLLSY